MFKLPVCPHCGTVYRFKDTAKAIRNKDNECYHCHQRFKAKVFPYMLIEAVILIAGSIGLNLLILSRSSSLNIIPLFAVTLGFILLIVVLIPFFTRFIKTETTKQTSKVKKKK